MMLVSAMKHKSKAKSAQAAAEQCAKNARHQADYFAEQAHLFVTANCLVCVCVLLPWPPSQYDARFTLYVHALCAVVSRLEARSYDELSSFIGGSKSGGGSAGSAGV